MYFPPLFAAPVRPPSFDPRLEVPPPPRENNPLDLSVKTIRPTSDPSTEEELLMLDHRKLANLAAGHSLMGRQLIDPALYRLGYGAEVIPGLTPFCFDRTTGVAVPTSQMMSSYLQQREQAFLAARNNAVAQQQAAAVAAAAAAYMDPANLPLHLRNGLTQREAAAALAATRGMYAAQSMPPAPMMLPAFSLYTEDKGAFKSLRNSVVTSTAERNAAAVLNGVAAAGEAARYAEHLQRLREQHIQHQTTGKCSGACCTSNGSAGLGQSCACCPSQAALCARSPMGCANKDPASAATGKICDFSTTAQSFLHRPTATTTSPAMVVPTTASSELRFSVSSLCTPQTTTEPTSVNSSRDKQQHSIYRSPIWNAGLPSATPSGKTAFSVPKKKESSHKESSSHHSKEHRSSGSIKDILKENQNGSSNTYENSKCDAPKVSSHSSKHDNHKKNLERYPSSVNDEFPIRYSNHRNSEIHPGNVEAHPFQFYKNSVISSAKSTKNSVIFNGNDSLTTVTSVTPVVTTRHEGGSIPITKMPPLLEAVRPSELHGAMEHSQEPMASVRSPQGPPPLIAVSSATDYSASTIIKSPYVSSENSSTMRLPSSIYPNVSIPVPSYNHSSSEKSSLDVTTKSSSSSSSSKSPKKTSSHSSSKYNGVMPMAFMNGEPQQQHPLAFPKPIPAKPIPQMPTAHHFSSHYRPAQHQLSLQTHNEWIPHANPNVTVAPLPQAPPATTTSVITSSNSATTAHRPAAKPQTVQREPDYADTPNVLQSLLIRSAGNAQPLSVTSASTESAATSVITSVNSLPLFNIDYRFPIGPQMSLVNGNREAFVGVPPLSLPLAAAQHIAASNNVLFKDSKSDVPKSTDNTSHSSSKHKKRSAVSTEDNGGSKKRIMSSDFNGHLPRYSFQPASFAKEASEVPECPYTFVSDPPLNYTSQLKGDDYQKPLWRDTTEKAHEISRELQKSPVLVPAKSPSKPTEPAWAPDAGSPTATRLSAVRARRRLVRRRICRGRRPLSGSAAALDPAALERRLAVRHARKLVSQLTLRWAHRRYVQRWNVARRRLLMKRRRRAEEKKEGKETKDSACTIPMPPEMKRLMVNKALGETQLHRAARLGYPQAVAYCLKTKCVSVNARDNAGYTPLHECCSRGHLDIARALLQYGADVNASAAGGIRPLHDAVENDQVEIVRLLLSYGADPTITTYSGLEPMKLARSAMMAEFLQGFLADISGEVDSRPHLPWRFWGSAKCLDPEDGGYDVLSGVPTDPESDGEGDNDFLFEVSDSPHLPTFRLLMPASANKAQCNYLRLNDVLRKLSINKEDFVQAHPTIEVLSLPRHEFEASATCSPLLTGDSTTPATSTPSPPSSRYPDHQGSTTDLVKLDKSIRKVLGIETISVR
ncbi:hypothetical protein JTE90_011362 [Oedothorax gibbosus]|uniref:BCL-6 corepressor PCGF1 binding domain-containing protein n=1 Tax=Oedothorax gibbosus TaxID=931172 RepID=A0AAV6VN23_9ARAC|nr:hypothetical protein JTE90_011362 [Oedothorax gibbosus]